MRVSWCDWDDHGKEAVFVGEVQDEFLDPDERWCRPSYSVRTDSGRVYTPYVDECQDVT